MTEAASKLRLIAPTARLEASHVSFLEEFQARDEQLVPWIVAEPYERFGDYVAMLEAASEGIGIPADFVPHSTFWLVDARDEIVAISNLRHRLNDFLLTYGGHIGYGVRPSARRKGYATELLRRTLVEARTRGIDRVRLTCSKSNAASAKTILRNGGVLDDEAYMPEHGEVICRYWIALAR